MNKKTLRLYSLCAGLVGLLMVLTAPQAEALYLFYMRKDLDHIIKKTPKKILDKQITVTDELCVIWPDVQDKPSELEGEKYVLFDTTYFKCAIPQDKMGTHLTSIWNDAKKGYKDVTAKIEAVNEQRRLRKISVDDARKQRRTLYWELYRIWSNKPIVTLFGSVKRADFWGPVRGRGSGVASESITLVVEKVRKPRRRWYRSLDK